MKRASALTAIVALLTMIVAAVGPIPSIGAAEPPPFDAASQDLAAERVMAQLEEGRSLDLHEIEGLDGLGPMPWLSMTPHRTRASVEAWRQVAAQLPAQATAAGAAAALTDEPLVFEESEAPGETGVNDTPETGDAIEGFGTGDGDTPLVTINGTLSGGQARPPIQGDCESVEDDGSIDLANPTPASLIQIALCVGEIGDGPFGETSGDIDFYSYGEVEEGTSLILDVFNISGSIDPVDSIIGIYDSAGVLLASVEDTGVGEGDTFIEIPAPATGEYFAAVAGCCELGADPFDSASGPGADETGTYEVFVVAFPPPCESVEDDGAIPLANPTLVGEQGFDFCFGELGDGPQEVDTDFYSLGEIPADKLLVVGVEVLDVPFDAVIGLYDAAGNVVASADGTDSPDDFLAALLEVEIVEAGEYFIGIAGCCELQGDPFDPATGAPSDEAGPYVVFFEAFDPPCESVEDDGAIPLANPTLAGEQGFDFCFGELGDGPQEVDTDFYSLGEIPAGELLVVGVEVFDVPFDAVIGLYDAAGNVVASADGTDSPDDFLAALLEVEIVEAGEYFIGIAGCCELQGDPFDPATGAPSDEAGPYAAFFNVIPPPCESIEDDGSIPMANDASGVVGDSDLFENVCFGFAGDGPHAETSGDVDFFRTRVLPEGRLLIVDFLDVEGTAAGAGDLTIGIYDEAGDLIATGQDDPAVSGPLSDFFSVEVPAEGAYYVAVGGGMPTDPFDPTTGTNTDIVSDYTIMFVVDTTSEFIGGPGAGWGDQPGVAAEAAVEGRGRLSTLAEQARSRVEPMASPEARLQQAKAAVRAETSAAVTADDEPVVDIDFFLVDLEAGDAISGGFDRARITGILDPDGVLRMGSSFNPTFIYPPDSPLRHDRLTGFDHVATMDGVHAIYVSEGVDTYEGELRVVRSGLGSRDDDGQQIIFLDFDGAEVGGDVFQTGVDATLSPLSAFLADWGLGPSDEDAVIDAVIDAVVETVDHDLRVLDGRNGDRDASGIAGEFDVEILNSRDHGDRWGDPDVTRIVIGGTIEELQIPTLGIAQHIDPGNLETEETAVVLLDLMSGPEGSEVSINTYPVADGLAKTDFVGFAVGHVAAHEIGHLIGSWHQETFNEVQALMDSGGDFPAIAGVGPDGIFGTADDTDPDFVEDEFDLFEGFSGIEDTAGRSVFALGTGLDLGPVCTITGTDGPDVLRGTDGDDVICGLGGADKIFGKGGNDIILAGSGIDTVDAGTGDDVVYGEDGDDDLRGQSGNDRLIGGPGDDRLVGNAGDDTLDGGSGDDRLEGGVGDDDLSGGDDDDQLLGSDGDDDITGGPGDDAAYGGPGHDVASGGDGDDLVAGGSGDDTLSGDADDDELIGGSGDDDLDGGSGTDTCTEGPGADTSVNCNP